MLTYVKNTPQYIKEMDYNGVDHTMGFYTFICKMCDYVHSESDANDSLLNAMRVRDNSNVPQGSNLLGKDILFKTITRLSGKTLSTKAFYQVTDADRAQGYFIFNANTYAGFYYDGCENGNYQNYECEYEYLEKGTHSQLDSYIGEYVLYNDEFVLVTNNNKNDLGIVPDTTKAYIIDVSNIKVLLDSNGEAVPINVQFQYPDPLDYFRIILDGMKLLRTGDANLATLQPLFASVLPNVSTNIIDNASLVENKKIMDISVSMTGQILLSDTEVKDLLIPDITGVGLNLTIAHDTSVLFGYDYVGAMFLKTTQHPNGVWYISLGVITTQPSQIAPGWEVVSQTIGSKTIYYLARPLVDGEATGASNTITDVTDNFVSNGEVVEAFITQYQGHSCIGFGVQRVGNKEKYDIVREAIDSKGNTTYIIYNYEKTILTNVAIKDLQESILLQGVDIGEFTGELT